MLKSSHLLRVEEKKARRKIFFSFAVLIALIIFLFLEGVPLLSKFSLLLTTDENKSQTNQSNNSVLLAPNLESMEEATNTAQITVKGFANSGDNVHLVVNDSDTDNITVGNDGKFRFDNLNLNEGDNNIYAKVVKGNKESPHSETIKITYKKTPPYLDVSEPTDGQIYTGDNKISKVTGKTDPDASINVNDRLVIVSSDGSFSYPVTLNEGDNNIKIVATDIAGNQTTIQRKATYKP